jgi:hypothetical protein
MTNRQHQLEIAKLSTSNLPVEELIDPLLEYLATKRGKVKWFEELIKFIRWINGGCSVSELPYNIFVFGNDKINSKDFALFSTLPIATCPGLGECALWCYSLKAWRYPAAFLRQLMNTILIQTAEGRLAIVDAFLKLPQSIRFRLYVDGDFDSRETVMWWMDTINHRPDIYAYGYSKSWEELWDANLFFKSAGVEWPSNYKLNRSSGGKDENNKELRDKIESLPICRGDFIGVRSSFKGKKRYANPDYARELRENFKKVDDRVPFVCGGLCGDCIPNGEHACGSERFQGVPIIIGYH